MLESAVHVCRYGHSDTDSFPTLRSSDLIPRPSTSSPSSTPSACEGLSCAPPDLPRRARCLPCFLPPLLLLALPPFRRGDRKSTSLHSSHTVNSYDVFWLQNNTRKLSYHS